MLSQSVVRSEDVIHGVAVIWCATRDLRYAAARVRSGALHRRYVESALHDARAAVEELDAACHAQAAAEPPGPPPEGPAPLPHSPHIAPPSMQTVRLGVDSQARALARLRDLGR